MKTEDSKVFGFNSSINKQELESLHSSMLAPMVNAVDDECCTRRQVTPDYAVFVGDSEYKENQDDWNRWQSCSFNYEELNRRMSFSSNSCEYEWEVLDKAY